MSRVHVAPVSFGLGDLVVSLPAIQAVIAEARRDGDETWLVARSPAQARLSTRIGGLSGAVDEDTSDHAARAARFVDLRDHPLQRDHWWGSPEFRSRFGAMAINDILSRICSDLGIAAEFSSPAPLVARSRAGLRETVLFVAASDGPTKHWPIDGWAALAGAVRDAGLDVALLSRFGAADMASVGIGDVVAATLGDAVDALSSCRAVVGVDTGLTHVAVQQGTPTVTICRPHPFFFRPWPHCRAVTGDPCDDACIAADSEHAHNATVSLPGRQWSPWPCRAGGRCMGSIAAVDVFDALAQIL
ncbi:MAG: glycosyltransferase family 9 protein [Acidimicrobiales bacterium]